MRVLMLGWEFPPFFAGGVGMVCYELTKALSQKAHITYIMPFGPDQVTNQQHVKLLIASNFFKGHSFTVKGIPTLLHAYQSSSEYNDHYARHAQLFSRAGKSAGRDNTHTLYGRNLLEEVYRFALQVQLIAEQEDFDIIHAHDWTTFPAALAVKRSTGKPLVVHIHITEFDKSGGAGANPDVYAIEKAGMDGANSVIAISNYVKNSIIRNYGIPPEKIRVVHNAGSSMSDLEYRSELNKKGKIVLFTGRITLQKGPEYFVYAAKKVLEHYHDVTFVMAGTGDMLARMIELTAHLGIAKHFVFPGFYTRDDAEKLFSMADVFVMPSVSEPFGIVPLEAMVKRTPTIISKQSGVSEIVNHCFKVDFWDIDQLANKIISLLHYPSLHETMTEQGYHEAKRLTWDSPADKCMAIYATLVQ
ncbi:MAG: glycosyltransferase family 4 protein [archaeon]